MLARRWTGDADGVIETPSGYIAKCSKELPMAGRFWLAPACREDPSQCIPVMTAWNTMHLSPVMSIISTYCAVHVHIHTLY